MIFLVIICFIFNLLLVFYYIVSKNNKILISIKKPPREDNMTNTKNSTLMTAGLAFSIVMFVTLLFGYKAQSHEIYSGLLITEFILILFPCILIATISKLDPKKCFRLGATNPLNLLISFVIAVLAIPTLAPLNILLAILEKLIFGKIVAPETPIPKNGTELIIAILVIGGSAGFCEELLFRGIIQKGLERFGGVKAIILTGVLFGFFHIYIQKFIPTFLLGMLLGYVAYITRSIFNTMLMHFTNNALAVLLSMLSGFIPKMGKSSGQTVDQAVGEMLKMPTSQMIAIILVYGVVFALFGTALGSVMFALYSVNKNKLRSARLEENAQAIGEPNANIMTNHLENNTKLESAKNLLFFLPGILIVLFHYTNELFIVYGSNIRLVRGFLSFFHLT